MRYAIKVNHFSFRFARRRCCCCSCCRCRRLSQCVSFIPRCHSHSHSHKKQPRPHSTAL